MKPDWVTKLLLSVVAMSLCLIAFNGLSGTAAVAQRSPVVLDTRFPNIQITGDQNGFYLFDRGTGRIWYYASQNFRGNPEEVGTLEEPGRRLGR